VGFIENYKKIHQHPVNKAIHAVGIPAIIISIPLMFYDRWWGAGLWAGSWILQFIGHGIERTTPAILSKGASPVANMIGSTLILVAIPLFFWHWPIALGLFVGAWVVSLIGNLAKGVSPKDLAQAGPAYFIVGAFWWFKKALGLNKEPKPSTKKAA